MRRLIVLIAVGALVLGACGSDDSSTELTADQERVVELVMETSGAEGLELNEPCVRDVISKLSPPDAKTLADNELGGNVELSPEGEALGEDLVTCLDRDKFIDALVADLNAGGVNVERDCIADALADVELRELFDTTGSGPPPEVVAALDACESATSGTQGSSDSEE
jgi:hypothetical protein